MSRRLRRMVRERNLLYRVGFRDGRRQRPDRYADGWLDGWHAAGGEYPPAVGVAAVAGAETVEIVTGQVPTLRLIR